MFKNKVPDNRIISRKSVEYGLEGERSKRYLYIHKRFDTNAHKDKSSIKIPDDFDSIHCQKKCKKYRIWSALVTLNLSHIYRCMCRCREPLKVIESLVFNPTAIDRAEMFFLFFHSLSLSLLHIHTHFRLSCHGWVECKRVVEILVIIVLSNLGAGGFRKKTLAHSTMQMFCNCEWSWIPHIQ